ncbi:hypothetical protein RF11_11535 [Thelohanellus kitauei]|uniref:Uncharacterized protein n=1 Tax=Thelohanellus kitauei TaxID=669202 RepID=A0A0C2JPM5_THEKT|nr:hypothetical protein RF11_11535 [Thelohanellus kitauei]
MKKPPNSVCQRQTAVYEVAADVVTIVNSVVIQACKPNMYVSLRRPSGHASKRRRTNPRLVYGNEVRNKQETSYQNHRVAAALLQDSPSRSIVKACLYPVSDAASRKTVPGSVLCLPYNEQCQSAPLNCGSNRTVPEPTISMISNHSLSRRD